MMNVQSPSKTKENAELAKKLGPPFTGVFIQGGKCPAVGKKGKDNDNCTTIPQEAVTKLWNPMTQAFFTGQVPLGKKPLIFLPEEMRKPGVFKKDGKCKKQYVRNSTAQKTYQWSENM